VQTPPERLGAFYLGAEYDLHSGQRLENPISYDARDLTTHAICVGMTGSGKTGLCIGLLEEAALDKVPTIMIDPKGDITNLLLQFPELRPEDFHDWINADDARRKGRTLEEQAQATAELWREGLADWGIGPDRIRLLQESADFTIFTPGSDAGVPISILGSLAAPGLNFEQHTEAIRERISGTVAALLGLAGVKAEPSRSREAILLSNIFEHFWSQGQDLDLAQLILSIQEPPVRQLGVFDVDTFYPQKDRFELAMAFNNLMASPSFQNWLQGEALDVDQLYYTREGKPRHSIFYIAHLSDSERMFFVTLLLENVLTWVRRQAGTTSLVYFDEVFGFLPPTAEPPSKRPLLTLLKQARAFGLGCVLVTQNPVDLDYKGLTNTGTWFIGKLQAERDKARVLQGLKGAIAEAGGSGEAVDYDTLLSQLRSRLFLLHNVHEKRPVVFHTRWAMSYLRGPLTRPQVRKLTEGQRQLFEAGTPDPPLAEPAAATVARTSEPAPAPAEVQDEPPGYSAHQPGLDSDVSQVFLPVQLSEQAASRQLKADSDRSWAVETVRLIYEPALIGSAEVSFVDRKRKISEQIEKILVMPPPDDISQVDWDEAETLPISRDDLAREAEEVGAGQGPFYAPAPEVANSARELKQIGKSLSDWLYYNSRMTITTHPQLGLFQPPDESERAFRIRLQQAAREERDEEVDELEDKYDTRISRLETKLRKQERELADDEADYQSRKQQEMIGIGETVLGFFMGRRRTSALSSAASKRRMTGRAGRELEETKEEIEDLQKDIAEMEAEMAEATDEITHKWADLLDDLSTEELAPRRTDVNVQLVALAWLPAWLVSYHDGTARRTATVAAYSEPEMG
jgi:ElaB/YqjD/DUF883 family membrane-anchored ribosome-binding protein